MLELGKFKNVVTFYISYSFLGGEYFASENKILNFLSLEISEFFFRMFICGDIVNKIVLKAPVTH